MVRFGSKWFDYGSRTVNKLTVRFVNHYNDFVIFDSVLFGSLFFLPAPTSYNLASLIHSSCQRLTTIYAFSLIIQFLMQKFGLYIKKREKPIIKKALPYILFTIKLLSIYISKRYVCKRNFSFNI